MPDGLERMYHSEMEPQAKRDHIDVLAERLELLPPEWVARIYRLRMRQLLRRLGVSDRDIARRLGVHPKTLWRDARSVRLWQAGKGEIPRDFPRADPDQEDHI